MPGSGSVLVIDDEPVLQDVLGTLLVNNDFDYHPAMTAEDGLRVLREEEVEHGPAALMGLRGSRHRPRSVWTCLRNSSDAGRRKPGLK